MSGRITAGEAAWERAPPDERSSRGLRMAPRVALLTEPGARSGFRSRLSRLRDSRLVRQNFVLFIGGLVAGLGGFVYHAMAGRVLGPRDYGEVATLVALYTVGTTAYLILILVLARYAANLEAEGRKGAIKHIVLRTNRLLALPAVTFCVLAAGFSMPLAAFLNLGSPWPLIWLGISIAGYWFVAIPRGVLQGTQRFLDLSANLSLELIVRTLMLAVFLTLGLRVTGAALAILAGVIFAYVLGLSSIRDFLVLQKDVVRMRTLVTFAVTATAGTLGVILLYNVDVVLAKHFLSPHGAGIYGGLNKIGFILYALTLSVSQVLFPRVIEAVTTGSHPGRLLFLSGALMSLLGLCVLVVFGLAPGLVVKVLFGPAFQDAQPYVPLMGCWGLALSLGNLLVQFLMAVHDRAFAPILGAACLLQPLLITLFHDGAGQVVTDVLVTVLLLLGTLIVRCLVLMPHLRPEMVVEDG
jgi:O-antigen/teichoic acid export membrane protein